MKVKGFKKGANMNFSNASGNGEQVEFTLSNGISGVMLLNESKTLISFSEAPKSDSVKVFANGNELSVTGRGKDYNTSAINTESTVEIEADSPNTGFGNWLENLIVLLSTALTDAFTPSRITVEECASRITFRLEDFTSFYQALVEDGGNAQVLLNPEGDTFLNYFVNVQAGLVGGEQYELPLIVNMPTNQFGDVALMADEYQSFDTYVENVSEVGFGEDFDGTFTVNITAENGAIIVSNTITDPNYTCEKETPIDDSGKDGCTDSTALNYDPAANNNDGSCIYEEEPETEAEAIKFGCTDSEATNFDPSASNDDGSCSYYVEPENEYLADVSGLTAVLGLTNENYGSLIDDTIYLIQQLQEDLEAANANQEDGASVAELDAALLDAQNQLAQLETATAMLNAVEDTIMNIAEAPCDLTDPATQTMFTALEAANVGAQTIAALRTLCTGNDGITIDDVNAATSDLNQALVVIGSILSNVEPENTQNIIYSNLATLQSDINSAINTLQANQEDGVSQADVDAAEAAYDLALNLQAGQLGAINLNLQVEITSLQAQVPIDAALAAAAQDLALSNLQAEFDALGLVYTEDEMIDLIQAAEDGIIPEDGVTAANVLAAEAVLNALIDTMFTQGQLDTAELAATTAAELAATQAAEALASITADNIQAAQTAYDLALAAAQGVSYGQGYDAGLLNGVDSDELNAQQIADAMALLAEGDEVYDAIFGEGVASIAPEDGISQADLDEVEALLDEAVATIAGGGTGAAYDLLMGELELAAEQLADATATNEAYEVFIQGVDTSMSRLERFLTDSYSYEAYDRNSLVIPANMQSENPDFENQPPSMTSIYVGDGTDFGNTSTYSTQLADDAPDGAGQSLASQFGEFSGGGKKAKSHSSFAYMMGKANHMREGFMNYSGELPFSRMDGNDDDADSTEEGFELTEGTKTGLWIFGGAIAAFGLYKVLKKK